MSSDVKDGSIVLVLANLGGPSNLEEVRDFLLNLLGDPNVIQLPFFFKPLQPLLAKLIVRKRLPFSQQLYRDIGGKSPLVEITEAQARALEKATGFRTLYFMTCSRPYIGELAAQLRLLSKAPDKVVLLPLYPQYSTSTTKSAIEQFSGLMRKGFPQLEANWVKSYESHPSFIAAWVERISNRLSRIDNAQAVEIVFSAHGIPERYVKCGDPYLAQLQSSVCEIMKSFPQHRHSLCFQSKFGPEKWLEPSTDSLITSREAGSKLLIVPISFVSDHVETIHEIGIEFAKLAQEHGVKLYRVPGLNTSPRFIECLADLAKNYAKPSIAA